MKTMMLMAGAALALTACGSSGEEPAAPNGMAAAGTNEAAGSNAAATAPAEDGSAVAPGRQGSMTLEPGLYEVKATIGMGGSNGSHSGTNCLTKEEIAKGNAGIFNTEEIKDCTQDAFNVGNGRIDAALTCSGGKFPGKTQVTMKGTYSSTAYDMDQKVAMEVQGMKMNIDSKITARRIGECPAGKTG
jgi:hypothetical protein